jgi:hypothetical protein
MGFYWPNWPPEIGGKFRGHSKMIDKTHDETTQGDPP